MLSTSIIKTESIARTECDTMFRLYGSYYDGAEMGIFHQDLEAKDYTILLRDDLGEVRGFSTLAVYGDSYRDRKVRILYSGDTIIDRPFWGQNQFARAWLTLAGQIKAEEPEIPLYWLLIVKGHRTYRYLSLFSKEYFPRYDCETPAEMQLFMHHVASNKFGQSYDASSGLVRFPEPRSFLNKDLAVIPNKDRERPEVKYFLQRNPSYYEGDELFCLCELESANLKSFAGQWFEEGRANHRS